MKHMTMKRVGAPISVILASLALGVTAVAGVRPDDRAGLRGIGATPGPTYVRPDDRAGLRVVGATNPSLIGRPDGRSLLGADRPLRPDDRAGFRGAGGEPHNTAFADQQAAAATAGGFDWTAAGTGAGAATALVLLLSWALMLRRNHRRASMPA